MVFVESPSAERRTVVRAPNLHPIDTIAMDTWISIQVVSFAPASEVESAVRGALGWFDEVERACSRFEPDSEVMRLGRTAERWVPVSSLLLESVDFALQLARLTDGAFDPTIGGLLERRGFDRSYRTGNAIVSSPHAIPTYRDIQLCRSEGTIRLQHPLVLDLGAVVKGLAIDLVARDLLAHGFHSFSVDAGGDLYARGLNANGQPWRVGVKHPRTDGLLPHLVPVTDGAVCTSGDYERRAPDGSAHVVDARHGSDPTTAVTSVSVLAPTAMAADGLSTAAMLLGPVDGLSLLEHECVDGLLVLADGTTRTTGTSFGRVA